LSRRVCPHCGSVFAVASGRPEQREGQLEEVRGDLIERLRGMSRRRAWHWAGADWDRLLAVQLAFGYKPGWVYRRWLEVLEQGGR
jgi:hypothetical protein